MDCGFEAQPNPIGSRDATDGRFGQAPHAKPPRARSHAVLIPLSRPSRLRVRTIVFSSQNSIARLRVITPAWAAMANM